MNPWFLVGGGVLVVGGAAFIAYRNEKAKQPDASSCGAVQSILRTAFQFDLPPAACPAVDAALGIVGAALSDNERAKDAENIRLNGAIDVPLDAATKSIAVAWTPGTQASGATVGSIQGGLIGHVIKSLSGRIDEMLTGSVLRFKNGGVPFKGHPDFAKCAPGTHDMGADSVAAGAKFYILVNAGVRPDDAQLASEDKRNSFFRNEASYAQLLTGAISDPSTSQKLGIVAGKKWSCPSGQTIVSISPVIDHRDPNNIGRAIQVICGAPGTTSAPPPPLAPTNTQPPGPAPGANYVWVPPVGTVAGHWERKRAA